MVEAHDAKPRALARGRRLLGVAAAAATVALGLGAAAESAGPNGHARPTARDITESLYKASAGAPLDFSGRDLAGLDLSGIDFKRATLAHADMFGVDLSGANLSGADLSGARLDRAVLTRANFSGAHLAHASILRPSVYSSLGFDRTEAPIFAGADLRHARVTARLDGADFSNADLTGFDMSPHETHGDITIIPRNICNKCNFAGAKLIGADFTNAVLSFASLAHADLHGANLRHSDLSRADLTGADLTDADLTEADLDGATLTGVTGLDRARGLAMTLNLERAVR
jgi:uncharacterized protein YjbI with pentapeptide repeats